MIFWIWGAISMFSSSEHTFTWPQFPAFLRWIAQSYLCVWCTAMSLHPSCLKASPPHPDTIAAAWLFFQPSSLLLIFIGGLFLAETVSSAVFFSVCLSEMSSMRSGGWKDGCDLKKKRSISVFFCQLMQLLLRKLIVSRKRVSDTKLTNNGHQSGDILFWSELLYVMHTGMSKLPTIRPWECTFRKGVGLFNPY